MLIKLITKIFRYEKNFNIQDRVLNKDEKKYLPEIYHNQAE